jgi:DNA-binding response OmpR family regulator
MFIRMGTTPVSGRCAILIVDDDDDIRAEMRDVFEHEGYSVLEAGDGVYALAVLHSKQAESICALVLDLRMPRMSGWELIETLRSDAALSRIPVVVTSGISVHGDASGIGATMYWLRKPFGGDELLAAVRSCGVSAAGEHDKSETPDRAASKARRRIDSVN